MASPDIAALFAQRFSSAAGAGDPPESPGAPALTRYCSVGAERLMVNHVSSLSISITRP